MNHHLRVCTQEPLFGEPEGLSYLLWGFCFLAQMSLGRSGFWGAQVV